MTPGAAEVFDFADFAGRGGAGTGAGATNSRGGTGGGAGSDGRSFSVCAVALRAARLMTNGRSVFILLVEVLKKGVSYRDVE